MDAKGVAAVLQEAFELQERITRQRKALKVDEALLKISYGNSKRRTWAVWETTQRKRKVVSRAVIVSERFRARWPEVFARIAWAVPKGCQRGRYPRG